MSVVAGAWRNFFTLSPPPEKASWTLPVIEESNAYLVQTGSTNLARVYPSAVT